MTFVICLAYSGSEKNGYSQIKKLIVVVLALLFLLLFKSSQLNKSKCNVQMYCSIGRCIQLSDFLFSFFLYYYCIVSMINRAVQYIVTTVLIFTI